MRKSNEVLVNGQWVKPKHCRAFLYKKNPDHETGYDSILANNHKDFVEAKVLGWFETKEEADKGETAETTVTQVNVKPRRVNPFRSTDDI